MIPKIIFYKFVELSRPVPNSSPWFRSARQFLTRNAGPAKQNPEELVSGKIFFIHILID